MNFELFDIPLTPRKNASGQTPFLCRLRVQENGALFVGAAFSDELLIHVKPNKKGTGLGDFLHHDIHGAFGDDAVAVCGGLQPSLSGDNAFVVLHEGSAPGFLKGLLAKKWPKLNAKELPIFLVEQDGGMGFACRHSVGQLVDGEMQVRRYKESGSLVDALHMGDFVFGLSSSSFWREPYLELRVEKRVYVRKDLNPNSQIHRDAEDNFWFYGDKDRLYRCKLNDIKAKPTYRKIVGPIWSFSAASVEDGWLYGVTEADHKLFRVRVNPVSFEDELQEMHHFEEGQICGLAPIELKSSSYLLTAVQTSAGVDFYKSALIKPEDPEFVPEIPKLEKIGQWDKVERVQDLALRKISESQYQVWGLAFGGDAGEPGKVFSMTMG